MDRHHRAAHRRRQITHSTAGATARSIRSTATTSATCAWSGRGPRHRSARAEAGWLAQRRGPANERGRAGAVFDHGDAMLAAGDEPDPDRERRQDTPGRKGSRGAQRPLASPNVRTLGRLAHDA